MSALAPTLQAFFTDRLVRQRQASPHTVAAYRDTLRLLVVFAAERRGIEPSKLDIDDLDAPLVGAFLDHLEHQRENGVRTRNARLAAIRSLFRYSALRHPEHAAVIARELEIPLLIIPRSSSIFCAEAVRARLRAKSKTSLIIALDLTISDSRIWMCLSSLGSIPSSPAALASFVFK